MENLLKAIRQPRNRQLLLESGLEEDEVLNELWLKNLNGNESFASFVVRDILQESKFQECPRVRVTLVYEEELDDIREWIISQLLKHKKILELMMFLLNGGTQAQFGFEKGVCRQYVNELYWKGIWILKNAASDRLYECYSR